MTEVLNAEQLAFGYARFNVSQTYQVERLMVTAFGYSWDEILNDGTASVGIQAMSKDVGVHKVSRAVKGSTANEKFVISADGYQDYSPYLVPNFVAPVFDYFGERKLKNLLKKFEFGSHEGFAFRWGAFKGTDDAFETVEAQMKSSKFDLTFTYNANPKAEVVSVNQWVKDDLKQVPSKFGPARTAVRDEGDFVTCVWVLDAKSPDRKTPQIILVGSGPKSAKDLIQKEVELVSNSLMFVD